MSKINVYSSSASNAIKVFDANSTGLKPDNAILVTTGTEPSNAIQINVGNKKWSSIAVNFCGQEPGPITTGYKYFLWYVSKYNDNKFHQQDLALYDSNASTTKIIGFTTLSGKESSNPMTENYPNGFDGDLNTKWYSSETYPNWGIFTNGNTINPVGISYRTPSDHGITNSRAPRYFKLCGSNTSSTDPNNASWNVIYETTDNDVFQNEHNGNVWVDLYFND